MADGKKPDVYQIKKYIYVMCFIFIYNSNKICSKTNLTI